MARVLSVVGITVIIVLLLQVVHAQALLSASATSSSHPHERLKERLQLSNLDLSRAIEERRILLTRRLTVHAVNSEGTVVDTSVLALQDTPSWIVFTKGSDGILHADLSEDRMTKTLSRTLLQNVPTSTSCAVLSTWKDDFDVTRAQTNCVGTVGYNIDRTVLIPRIKDAFLGGKTDISTTLTLVNPRITDDDYSPQSAWRGWTA